MDDIEKTLIDLDFNINDCITKEAEVYDSYLNIKNKREDTEDKINKYDKKIEKLNHELDDLKVIRISFLTVPSIGFACFGMAMLFNVPVSLIVGIFALGSVSGFKLADDMVRSKMINASDELLLRRLFPVIDKKNREIKKISNARNKCVIEVQELFLSEEALREQHEELVDGIDKLKEIKDSVLDLHLKKLRREYLPYHTDLEEVIKCTVSNPEQFYRDVCNSLKYEERRDIILDMYDKTCENCQNHSCRLTQNEKDKMSDCKSWYNEVEIGMSKVLKR